MATDSLSNRMLELERTVRLLQERLDGLTDPHRRWWVDDAGRFANDATFDEIVRLGREYRKSLTPPRAAGRDRS